MIARALRRVPPAGWAGAAALIVAGDLIARLRIRAAEHVSTAVYDGLRDLGTDLLGELEDIREAVEEIRDQEPAEGPRDWSAEDTVQAFRTLRRDGVPPDVAAKYVQEWRQGR